MGRKSQYKFTSHAIARFKERSKGPFKTRHDMVGQLAREFYDAKENRAYLNNTNFMVHLGETYGYSGDFEFRVGCGKVFVCREKALVTVYLQNNSHFSDSSSRFKR